MGGVTSSFIFESYKIDRFEFKTKDAVGVLAGLIGIPPEDWQFSLAFRQPIYFEDQKIYIGGIEVEMRVPDQDEKEEELVTLSAGIAGLFKSSEGVFPEEIEQKLVKVQIPTILLPYLRSSVMSFLANAGFGSVVLPLINIAQMAKDTLGKIEVLRR